MLFALAILSDARFLFDLKEEVGAVVVEDRIVAVFLCVLIYLCLYVIGFLFQHIQCAIYIVEFKLWRFDQLLHIFE